MKEVVDATTPIAEAAAREAWPYKKVLLAVLPPTLALFSVLIGVWDNGRRDRNARAEAEDVRAAQVVKDQETAEKESKLREAELVLPKYETLLRDVHATVSAVNRCSDAIRAYRDGDVLDGWGGLVGSGPVAPGQTSTWVDPSVVDSCSQIEATVDPLALSVDTALLVSNPTLAAAATRLAGELEVVSETAQHLLDAVQGGPEDDGGAYLLIGATDFDGRSWYEVVDDLSNRLTKIDPAAENLISTVRGVVLLGP